MGRVILMTNSGSIRTMSDEQLMDLLLYPDEYFNCDECGYYERNIECDCKKGVLDWLSRPVEDEKYEE